MPDSNGFPTPQECLQLINITAADDPPNGAAMERVPGVISAVIAEFESPPGRNASGGTGRLFHQVTETRLFDGNGVGELLVHDLVASQPVAVLMGGSPLADIKVRTALPNRPTNVIYREQVTAATVAALGYPNYADYPDIVTPVPFPARVFPVGLQNIAVNATWGNAVTADIFQAILCEVAYRILIESSVGLDGVGEDIEIGNFHVNTGQTAFASPLTLFHSQFELAKRTYRIQTPRRFVRSQPRMI